MMSRVSVDERYAEGVLRHLITDLLLSTLTTITSDRAFQYRSPTL
jgi:hypothetical protein